tara:strand:- start:1597 stop:2406 length:810 start_codon:yes stop_codon:yes gene_type:complete
MSIRNSINPIGNKAEGRWGFILSNLGIAPQHLKNRHGPCPSCGGVDRFRFDDKEGRGTFYCGGGGEPAYGDGFTLLSHIYGWDFKTAADEVRKVLGIGTGENPRFSANVISITKPQVSKTQLYAERLWKAANTDDEYVAGHPYCARKGITWACGASRGSASGKLIGKASDCVIVPQRTLEGDFCGVECINPEGVKQSFGKKGILSLGNTLDTSLPIYVVEGWADGVATWKYFNNVVVIVVFGIGKQQKLAEGLNEAQPFREIILVEDAA